VFVDLFPQKSESKKVGKTAGEAKEEGLSNAPKFRICGRSKWGRSKRGIKRTGGGLSRPGTQEGLRDYGQDKVIKSVKHA